MVNNSKKITRNSKL